MGTGSFPGGKERPGRDADHSPLLVLWSWKGRVIPLLPLWAVRPVQSLSACTMVTFTFTFTYLLLDPFEVHCQPFAHNAVVCSYQDSWRRTRRDFIQDPIELNFIHVSWDRVKLAKRLVWAACRGAQICVLLLVVSWADKRYVSGNADGFCAHKPSLWESHRVKRKVRRVSLSRPHKHTRLLYITK